MAEIVFTVVYYVAIVVCLGSFLYSFYYERLLAKEEAIYRAGYEDGLRRRAYQAKQRYLRN